MKERIKSLLIYAAKCVTGTLVVFTLSSYINYIGIAWCLISVNLVLSPDAKDSMTLALTRIKANVVGASVGLLCLFISLHNMWVLCIALVMTLSFCYLFRIDEAARSALAATVIIMLHEEGRHIWDTALERVVAVLTGCIIGLIITYIFHFNTKSVEGSNGKYIDEA